MTKKIIIANWKTNPQTAREAKEIFDGIKKVAGRMSKVETIICPPFVYLQSLGSLASKKKQCFQVGSQNLFYEEKGPFTGEISPLMLKNLGVKYAIIGHSERRALGETNEMINKKIKAGLKAGIKIIFCVGEKERDHDSHYFNFIKEEIVEGLKDIQKKFLKNIIIAYEPVWAISSNVNAEADNPESCFRMAIFIRRLLLPIIGNQMARTISILYGGSVNPENAEGFLKNGGVQGLLVGGQSLIPKNFGEIIKIANKIK